MVKGQVSEVSDVYIVWIASMKDEKIYAVRLLAGICGPVCGFTFGDGERGGVTDGLIKCSTLDRR